MAVVTVAGMADAMAAVRAAETARHAAHVTAKPAAVVAAKVVAAKAAVAETANAATAAAARVAAVKVAAKAVAAVTASAAKPPKPAARSVPKFRPARCVSRANRVNRVRSANHASRVKHAHPATANAGAVAVRVATVRPALHRPIRSKTVPTSIRWLYPSHRRTTLPPER